MQNTETILRKLAAGCPWHPAYRYKRKPNGHCDTCANLYQLRRKLDQMDEDAAEAHRKQKEADAAWDAYRDSMCQKAMND